MIRVENLQALVMPDCEARWDLNGISDDVRDDYEAYAPMQNSHFVDSDEHWVPRPKRLERIGCYATASWVPKDSGDRSLSC